jgi:hypothetical protein
MKSIVISALIVMLSFNTAKAEYYDGNKLRDHCLVEHVYERNPDALNETMWLYLGTCFGNINGVMSFLREFGLSMNQSKVCLPATISSGQAIKVVRKYLDANPERLHESASSLIYAALYEAYACEPEN